MSPHQRRSPRLNYYDYSQQGYYFVTICTKDKGKILGQIRLDTTTNSVENQLSKYGLIAKKQLMALETRYNCVKIDKYVIMPNHIHAIVIIDNSQSPSDRCPSLSQIIGTFKSLTTRECFQKYSCPKLFQVSFHDHVIRGKQDYSMIWQYIDSNPLRWKDDCFFSAD